MNEKDIEKMELDNDEWTNHWDINPDEHGGAFVKWIGGKWKVVITTPSDCYPAECSNGEMLFESIQIYPDEVFKDGNPENGFTDEFQNRIDSISNINVIDVYDYESWKGVIHDLVSYYGVYHLNGQESWMNPNNYWENLESHGIPAEKFK